MQELHKYTKTNLSVGLWDLFTFFLADKISVCVHVSDSGKLEKGKWWVMHEESNAQEHFPALCHVPMWRDGVNVSPCKKCLYVELPFTAWTVTVSLTAQIPRSDYTSTLPKTVSLRFTNPTHKFLQAFLAPRPCTYHTTAIKTHSTSCQLRLSFVQPFQKFQSKWICESFGNWANASLLCPSCYGIQRSQRDRKLFCVEETRQASKKTNRGKKFVELSQQERRLFTPHDVWTAGLNIQFQSNQSPNMTGRKQDQLSMVLGPFWREDYLLHHIRQPIMVRSAGGRPLRQCIFRWCQRGVNTPSIKTRKKKTMNKLPEFWRQMKTVDRNRSAARFMFTSTRRRAKPRTENNVLQASWRPVPQSHTIVLFLTGVVATAALSTKQRPIQRLLATQCLTSRRLYKRAHSLESFPKRPRPIVLSVCFQRKKNHTLPFRFFVCRRQKGECFLDSEYSQ